MNAILDLPKTTYFGKIIAKDKIYTQAGADSELRDMFVKQVERIRWLHKISPETANIGQGEQVREIQVIEISLTTPTPDKRILLTILKAVRYKIVFVLVYEDKVTYTVYYDNKNCFSSDAPPKLIGNNADIIWENIIVHFRGSAISEGKSLGEQIAIDAMQKTLLQKMELLEKQVRNERQPRRKWELNEELKKLRNELEDTDNG